MNENLAKHLGQVEIADLIEESVANAAIRRQQVMEDSLIDVSDEEAKNVEGGLANPIRIILGLIWDLV
ncbi:hypothetical protein [Crocosphaera sp. XPORK-15E]|uniref:hypothetical protein n=1 Tax=Crocosphaera sp. XPORK-15E TaxID=3110247 RepID=UPI002B212A51|nr:hypothetical protein [Crocosphaera sp. XPORK-15E]MEA5535815.1 hypothetical protein [Crocosphaera sp. XPORK-15E]